jgi:hypothetical protein
MMKEQAEPQQQQNSAVQIMQSITMNPQCQNFAQMYNRNDGTSLSTRWNNCSQTLKCI